MKRYVILFESRNITLKSEVDMHYFEMSVKTSVEAIDAVTNLLYHHGATGVMILNPNDVDFNNKEEGKWDYYDPQNLSLDFDGALLTGYFEDCDMTVLKGDFLESLFALKDFEIEIGLGEVDFKEIFPSEWENEWKKYFKPFRLGNRIVVKPSWETFDVQPDDLVIEIDPGNSFGSGTHETTSMCIEMLEKYMKSTDAVIDVGCGSGILSIAAGLLGSKKIVAVDIDALAVETAKENVARNGLSDVTDVRQGDLLQVITEQSEVVVANIIADVIVILADDIDKVLKPNGIFISSGIINTKAAWVLESLEKRDFEIIESIQKGEWVVIVSRKKSGKNA